LSGEGSLQLWLSSAVAIAMVGVCFLGPLIGGLPSPNAVGLTPGAVAIGSSGHLLGTDDLGRDVLSRALSGGQVSIEVGLGSVIIGLLVGGVLGLVAGYYGKLADLIISRILDMFLAFPALVLALAVAAYLGPNERDEILAISFFTVPGFGRLTRAAVMRMRQEEFITANRAIGARSVSIIIKHVVPNIAGSMLTFGLFTMSGAMLAEAGLSFLGAGIRPPEASWGNMIAEGQEFLSQAPHIFLVPACFLLVTILSINLIGDSLRTRYDL
jgi:peptide/nickel transport system permease protein